MDETCNKLEINDLSGAIGDAKVVDNDTRCESPVFKCGHLAKATRAISLDSSDYDIPSYQINQSAKSKASSKHGSETKESILPLSPICSPIQIPSAAQFQPPSIHSLGTVAKILDKSCKNKVDTLPQPNKEPEKSCGLFESLGMNDKDVSWVSSMASPPPKRVPGSEFNTVEKATFLPEDKFQNIQPRALFSPNLDKDFDCHPISFCSGSEDDDEAYKSNIRLSDVCATFRQLEVKSLDQAPEGSTENIILQENSLISPVIRTRRKKIMSVKKKKQSTLVVSPSSENKYEFSVGQEEGSNFMDDDSFQSMSFSGIDELCKKIVTDKSKSSTRPNLSDCDKTLPNPITNNIKSKTPKMFYCNKTNSDVYKVTSLSDLYSNAKALEEKGTNVSVHSQMDQSFVDKGIIRLDILTKDIEEVEATQHVNVTESEGVKSAEENTDWEKMKAYMSESQLNVSESEIFKTVENLEKTLAGQDSRDLGKSNASNIVHEAENSPSKGLCSDSSSFKTNPDTCTAKKDELGRTLDSEDPLKSSALNVEGSLEKKLHTQDPSKCLAVLEERNDALSEHDTLEGKLEGLGTRVGAHCIDQSKGNIGKALVVGFSTCSGKDVKISSKALGRAKALMAECDENCEVMRKDAVFSRGFSSCFGKTIQVSAKSLERAKTLMKECGGDLEEAMEGSFMEGFSVSAGKKMEKKDRASEKAETLGADHDESSKDKHLTSSDLEKTVAVLGGALEGEKAPTLPLDHKIFESSNEEVTVKTDDICQTLDNPERSKPSAQESVAFGFSTALGNKVKVSSKALEKVKSLWTKSDESLVELSENLATAAPREPSLGDFSCFGGNTTSESANEGTKDISVPESSANVDDVEDCKKITPKNESEVPESDRIDVSDGWEEIIPSWLHVYNTSPSDETSLTGHDSRRSSKTTWDYIVRSPVLGKGDRFFGKRKRRKLECEDGDKCQPGIVAPRTDGGRKGGAKRTSALSMDFSMPFKRVKFVEEADSEVKAERTRRRELQEQVVKEKHKVKPSQGLHFSRKHSEEQTSWKEAVGGSSPEVFSDESLKTFGVKEAVLRVNVQNAASFIFRGDDFFGPSCVRNVEGIPAGDDCVLILDDENNVGIEEIKRAFLASPGVQPSLVPDGWVENHFKWIVWKLAHYERSFPRYFARRCLTPNNLMLQLKYRYDREIDRNERSALKKILERDDTPAKRMVLCVCGVEKTPSKCELSLTDGWYSCPARPDTALAKFIDEGKVCVGTKLIIQGAVLVNCEEGIAPLEMSKNVYLKISTNSTRRARWDVKLGFQKNPQNFPVCLNSIIPGGGTISRIDVIIVRIYPVLYMEKTPDGRHVTRNCRSEEKADAEYKRIQEQKMESICHQVRTEMRKKKNLSNNSQTDDVCDVMEGSSNPSAVQELMAADRQKSAEEFHSYQIDRLSRELAEKVAKRLESENVVKRNVSEFFRAKIVDIRKPDYNNPAVLSVWHPNEDLASLLAEGKVISLTNISISNSSRACRPLQINTTRQTQYIPIGRSVKYPARKVTQLKDISSTVCPAFEEVDLVGMVVLVKDISRGSRLSQVVYLTDSNMDFAGIVFWGSCRNYGWENVLKVRCVVACSNLQWKRNFTPQNVPSLYVSESSVFTENPKQSYLKEEMSKLRQSIPQDTAAFLTKCEEALIGKLEESQWRGNCSRDSSANDSHPSIFRANQFESRPTASSTPIKPFTSRISSDEAEPSPIQKRLEYLQSYGEPPSLVPLVISHNKRKFRKKTSLSRTSQ